MLLGSGGVYFGGDGECEEELLLDCCVFSSAVGSFGGASSLGTICDESLLVETIFEVSLLLVASAVELIQDDVSDL